MWDQKVYLVLPTEVWMISSRSAFEQVNALIAQGRYIEGLALNLPLLYYEVLEIFRAEAQEEVVVAALEPFFISQALPTMPPAIIQAFLPPRQPGPRHDLPLRFLFASSSPPSSTSTARDWE
eukprot:scaffold318_cov332-Ochromonas_danica.AAC.5